MKKLSTITIFYLFSFCSFGQIQSVQDSIMNQKMSLLVAKICNTKSKIVKRLPIENICIDQVCLTHACHYDAGKDNYGNYDKEKDLMIIVIKIDNKTAKIFLDDDLMWQAGYFQYHKDLEQNKEWFEFEQERLMIKKSKREYVYQTLKKIYETQILGK